MNKIISKNHFDPLILIILDGWGLSENTMGNASHLAKTSYVDSLFKKYPWTKLCASGECVGLAKGLDGNSEAGHENIGAGRIVLQDATWINERIKDGQFYKNPAFKEAFFHCQENKSDLHLMGLLATADSAHAQPEHLYALIKLVKKTKLKNIYLHLFTDGRDSSPHQALTLLAELKKVINKDKRIKIATIMGRYYAMDRIKKWDRTQEAYQAMTRAKGLKANSAEQAITQAYNKGQTDEFINPTVIVDSKNQLVAKIEDNDSVIFFNLRSDRARQMTKPFIQKNFEAKGGFKRQKKLKNIKFVTLTDFGPDLDHVITAYPSRDINDALPKVLEDYRQLYISEQEKYAHVTYFFNGGHADRVDNEERKRFPSPKVSSYAQKPEMSAYKITDYILDELRAGHYDFVTVNYPNPDMVGHTGDLKAGIKACEHIDNVLKELIPFILKKKGTAIITADHGNIEEMINIKTGEIDTKHSTNPVPFIIVNKLFDHDSIRFKKNGKLCDIAPTILELLKVKKPAKMKGKSLIK